MQKILTRVTGAVALGSMLLAATAAMAAGGDKSAAHSHDHGHDHGHQMTEAEKQIYKGYFENAQVKTRTLSDWEGDWQSVYPYLLND